MAPTAHATARKKFVLAATTTRNSTRSTSTTTTTADTTAATAGDTQQSFCAVDCVVCGVGPDTGLPGIPSMLMCITHNKQMEKAPVVYMVHGGAWCWGQTKSLHETAQRIQDATGLECVCVTYGRSSLDTSVLRKILIVELFVMITMFNIVRGRATRCLVLALCMFMTYSIVIAIVVTDDERLAKHPAHVLDIVKSINQHDAGRGRKFILLGHSAGAHLAGLIATDRRYLGEERFRDLVGFVGLSGLYSIARVRESAANVLMSSVLDPESVDDPEDAFALAHVGPHIPPVFLAVTASDFGIISHAKDMYYACLSAGVDVTYKYYRNSTHFSIKNDNVVLDDLVQFFSQVFGNNTHVHARGRQLGHQHDECER